MRLHSILGAFSLSLVATIPLANADIMRELSRLEGYKITHTGTVTGYIDKDGEAQDGYKGCDHGRVLIVDDKMHVTCKEYDYNYASSPTIIILERWGRAIAIIDEEVYDVSLD